jgi:hypothetical protein
MKPRNSLAGRLGGTRVLVITSMTDSRVTASRNGTGLWPVSILRNRIFTDAKQRRTGFSLVQAQEASGVDAGAAGAQPSDAAK